MKASFPLLTLMANLLVCWGCGFEMAVASTEPPAPLAGNDGIVHMPAFDIPPSKYMSAQARQALIDGMRNPLPIDRSSILQFRRTLDEFFFSPLLEKARARYAVETREEVIAGVRVAIVTPAGGVDSKKARQILINLHGGGFVVGAGLGGLTESVPIAAIARVKVISVDYRQGPEHKFPAASEDVAGVYRALLKQYRPENIGIYGCSAGGQLAAEAVAWFDKVGLPQPGGIGVFCAGASARFLGDSSYLESPLAGYPPSGDGDAVAMEEKPYFGDADLENPLVSPVVSPELLARFPPTLLITGTRSGELSVAAYTHGRLIKAGALAELHVWDGMWHGFLYDIELPEAQEAYAVIAGFFERHLGRRR